VFSSGLNESVPGYAKTARKRIVDKTRLQY